MTVPDLPRQSTPSATGGAPLDVLVIGAGQAGLALGHHLSQRQQRFLLVDAGARVGDVWRSRWDSLRLFTAAEYDGLPGLPFPARAGTYPGKEEVADYLETYAEHFRLPVRLRTRVEHLQRDLDGAYAARTSTGTLRARQVVIATGPFQVPVIPRLAAGLSGDVVQVHSAAYQRPDGVPDGCVLVVGAGNSGVQIAVELAAAGRTVTLAAGTPTRTIVQKPLGKDLFWWFTRTGLIDKTADSRLGRRFRAQELVVGTTWTALRRRGVALRPRMTGATGRRVTFADKSSTVVDAVVWATGFGTDYSWLDVPGVLVDGRPQHRRGVTDAPGLFFLGQPWQHTRGSALLGFVDRDAAWLAARLTATPAARDAHRRQTAVTA